MTDVNLQFGSIIRGFDRPRVSCLRLVAQSRSTSSSWPTLWAASSLSAREGSATTSASDGIRYVVCSLVLVFGMQQRLISFLMLTLFVVLVALPTKCPIPTLHTLAQGTPTPPHLLHLPLLWHQHQLRYQHPSANKIQQNPTMDMEAGPTNIPFQVWPDISRIR